MSMSSAEIELLAHELRTLIQQRTCCPTHAGDVILHVLAGFALDDAADNPNEAAVAIRNRAKALADDIRRGKLVIVRSRQ